MKIRFRNIFIVLSALLFILSSALPAKAAEDAGMLYGTMEYYSTVNDGETIADIYHYSDKWFFESSAQRNDDLALTSMQLMIYSAALGSTALAVRIITCFLCGCMAGLLVFLFYRDRNFLDFTGFEERASHDTHPNLLNVWRNIKATGLYFLFGILLSALFQRYVPQDLMANVFG